MKKFFAIGFSLLVFLSACSLTPAPPLETLQTPPEALRDEAAEQKADAMAAEKKDSAGFELPAFTPVDSAQASGVQTPDSVAAENPPVKSGKNLYFEIPVLAEQTFASVDSLLNEGDVKRATELLESFVVLSPLWKEWMDRATLLMNQIQERSAKVKEEFQPLIFQIINMNAAGASYALVREFTDSLSALSPGDSLVAWANREKEKSFRRNYAKADKEKTEILSRLKSEGNYDAAETQITRLIQSYPEFADTLGLESALLKVAQMRLEESEQSKKFWETHDPEQAFAQAKKKAEDKKYLDAKKDFLQLKSSVLRPRAVEELEKLGELYCSEQRTQAANLFKESRKPKDREQANQKIKDAISLLDRCLVEFPENKQSKTVIQNKQLLLRELTP